MLSQDEAVFSVPAVTQWRVDEMADFVVLPEGQTVFIVPDADWKRKWQVRRQAIQCYSYLRGFGLERVFVAAPPVDADGLPLEGPYGEMKGVDDFLGAGNKLDQLVVVRRELPEEFDAWEAKIAELAKEHGRGRYLEGVRRDAEVLRATSLSAGISQKVNGKGSSWTAISIVRSSPWQRWSTRSTRNGPSQSNPRRFAKP